MTSASARSLGRQRFIALAVLFLFAHSSGAQEFRLPTWPRSRPSPDLHLKDTTGRAVTMNNFRGRVVVVYFGFARCPDACPTQLHTLAVALRSLKSARSDVQVLFITLDPERDPPTVLDPYVRAFDPSFRALTGTSAEIGRAAQDFFVEFARVPQGSDYTIDHTTGIFVFDRAGHLRLVGAASTTSADFAHDFALLTAE